MFCLFCCVEDRGKIRSETLSAICSKCFLFFFLFLHQFSGADDVIAFYSEAEIDADDEPLFEEQNILFKELSIRKEYNVVFLTTPTHYDKEFIRSFVSPKGVIVDTIDPALPSDDYGVLKIFFYSVSCIACLHLYYYCFYMRSKSTPEH